MSNSADSTYKDAWVRLLWALFLSTAAIVGVGAVVWALAKWGRVESEVALPVLLVAGVIDLILVFGVTALLFKQIGIASTDEAFGLPDGTIRAVIALGLILIFGIMAVFLYSSLNSTRTSTVPGISQAQFEELDPASIQFKTLTTPVVVNGTPEPRYNVGLILPRNETSDDFAKQILTTVSTLVVAVAGFYFGSKAVALAKGAETPSLRVTPPGVMRAGQESLLIKTETTPRGLGVVASEADDPTRILPERAPGTFQYSRRAGVLGPVELLFSLAAYPDVTQTLKVEIEPSSGAEALSGQQPPSAQGPAGTQEPPSAEEPPPPEEPPPTPTG